MVDCPRSYRQLLSNKELRFVRNDSDGRVPPHISERNSERKKEKRKDVQLLSSFSQNLKLSGQEELLITPTT